MLVYKLILQDLNVYQLSEIQYFTIIVLLFKNKSASKFIFHEILSRDIAKFNYDWHKLFLISYIKIIIRITKQSSNRRLQKKELNPRKNLHNSVLVP